MKRLHLFEFEDQKWFPSFIREYITDYLRFVGNKFGILNPSLALIVKTLQETKKDKILDVCSGGSGAWLSLFPLLKKEVPNLSVSLSDLYPNKRASSYVSKMSSGEITYGLDSLDAVNMKESANALRTQCLSYHHFQEDMAVKLLQNAVDNKDPILILEGQERTVKNLIQFSFVPLFVLLLTPFILPFSIGRLIFTYLIPILPIIIFWDGLISVLRTYSPKEMDDLIKKVKNGDSYIWETGRFEEKGIVNLYLKGIPK